MKNFIKSLSPLRLLAAMALLTLGIPSVFADALSDGEAAFQKGDFAGAARAFETALSSQGASAGLYYNLAMAQMRSGEAPAATLSLRRAILLDPRNVDARMALSDLERSQGVPAASSHWTARWPDLVAEKVPLKFLTLAGSLLGWLGAFLLLMALFRRQKKWGTVAASVLLVVVGIGMYGVALRADPRFSQRNFAVVVSEAGATLLSAPADQSAVIVRMPAGSPVHVRRRSGDWSYCETPSGEKGWTTTTSIERVVPAA